MRVCLQASGTTAQHGVACLEPQWQRGTRSRWQTPLAAKSATPLSSPPPAPPQGPETPISPRDNLGGICGHCHPPPNSPTLENLGYSAASPTRADYRRLGDSWTLRLLDIR
jgi:hypothetical protein